MLSATSLPSEPRRTRTCTASPPKLVQRPVQVRAVTHGGVADAHDDVSHAHVVRRGVALSAARAGSVRGPAFTTPRISTPAGAGTSVAELAFLSHARSTSARAAVGENHPREDQPHDWPC